MAKQDSLCWNCARATKKCCWSRKFKPVPGWNATPTKIYVAENKYDDSYMVHSCPLFKKDVNNNIQRVSSAWLSEILNISARSVCRLKKQELIQRCLKEGYNIEVGYKNNKKTFYLINKRTPALFIPSDLAKLFRLSGNTEF